MIAAIVQARTGSARLPKKICLDVMGKPVFWHFLERVKAAKLVEKILIATTTNPEDETIVNFANKHGIEFFQGSECDVLDRFYQTAKKFSVDIIVRVTPDCPLIDPRIIDKVIKYFLTNTFDYASNTHPRTYPDGLDVEVFSFPALRKAWEEAKKPSEREHVTPYLWRHPGVFKLGNIRNDKDLSYLRWVLDEKSDLEFVREVYERLYKQGKIFYMEDILKLLQEHPRLRDLNAGIECNEGYQKSLREDARWRGRNNSVVSRNINRSARVSIQEKL